MMAGHKAHWQCDDSHRTRPMSDSPLHLRVKIANQLYDSVKRELYFNRNNVLTYLL